MSREDEVVAHYRSLIETMGEMGLGLARAKGWKATPDGSVHDQGLELVKAVVPLLIEDLRAQGLIS